jgi:signal transduction histidine kinase
MADRRVMGRELRAHNVIKKHAKKSTAVQFPGSRARALQDWPVSYRLMAVIVVALIMGLVFGGLRVAAAADSAAGFGRVTQLANLGQQVTGLVQALENERDETAGVVPASSPQAVAGAVQRYYTATDAAAGPVKALAAGIGGSFPANIQARVATVVSLIDHLGELRSTADSLEQNEEDPDRLSALFAMDHMVTRMRRNSENLLLLAGHESARKWSEPVSLADVIQAATAEIEQYQRVTLNIQPGVAVSGHAVSDVVHLLAEIIENATVFSPKDTRVRVSAQQLTNGGVLIEVSDNGSAFPRPGCRR